MCFAAAALISLRQFFEFIFEILYLPVGIVQIKRFLYQGCTITSWIILHLIAVRALDTKYHRWLIPGKSTTERPDLSETKGGEVL